MTKAEGLAMAENFECQCHETAAAEEFESVEAVFHDLLRDISRINERQLPLQNLYISEGEAKPDLLTPSPQVSYIIGRGCVGGTHVVTHRIPVCIGVNWCFV